MTDNNSAAVRVILKALAVLVNSQDSVRALSGMTKHACSTFSEGRQYITCCTWLTTYSGLAIMLAVLAFNLMGDALRDLLDSRLQGE